MAINTVDSTVSSSQNESIVAGGFLSCGKSVCINASRISAVEAEATVSSAQILKTGRWKFKGIITNVSTSIFYIIYLIYIPEGYPGNNISLTEGSDVFYAHPEWVIAWTRKDYVSIEQSNEISLTSRLKRNLNTNDRVQLRVLLHNMGNAAININQNAPIVRGTVSYCCRAN